MPFQAHQQEFATVHELEVHQIELEMQNDELRRVQQKLESIVTDRTAELTGANLQLTEEIEERKKAEATVSIPQSNWGLYAIASPSKGL